MCRSRCIAQFRRYKDILQFIDHRCCSVRSGVCFNRSQGLFQPSDATIKPIKHWSSMSCLFWSQNLILYRSDLSQWSQSSQSFRSRTGALPNWPTKELRRLLALFLQILELIYCTNCLARSLQYNIFYDPKTHPNVACIPFFRDLGATWPISKSETPWGFQGTLSKMWYLRHAFYVSFIRFLAVLPVHHVCSLAIYMFLFLYLNSSCVPFI